MSKVPSPLPDPSTFAGTTCPAAVSFAKDIKPLFTGEDWGCMITLSSDHDWNPILDLRDYESVKAWAADINDAVSSGLMPLDTKEGSWAADKLQLFACWIKLGCLP
jgi:hypothetical protein